MNYIIAKEFDGEILYFAGISKGDNPDLVWTKHELKARRYPCEDAVLRHLALIPGGRWKQIEAGS